MQDSNIREGMKSGSSMKSLVARKICNGLRPGQEVLITWKRKLLLFFSFQAVDMPPRIYAWADEVMD